MVFWCLKNWKKIALACLFFVVDVLIWCLSQYISVWKKKKKTKNRDLRTFYFVLSTDNLGLERSKGQKLAKWRSKKFLAQLVKNGASNHSQKGFPSDGCEHILSEKKCVWLILIIIKTVKWWFFAHALTQERIGTGFGGIQPIVTVPKRHFNQI